MKTLNVSEHMLLVGWDPVRTVPLLKLLLREQQYSDVPRQLVLCVRADIDNPMPEQIGFVKVPSFSDDEGMARAGIEHASCIIIDNPDDDVTMTAALYSQNRNPDAHIIAYFRDEQLGRLLKNHCPNVECMPSVATEMIAKAAADPGSSRLHHQLLNVDEGMTQYSIRYPDVASPASVAILFDVFKRRYDATLIGMICQGERRLRINPPLDAAIMPGATLYYIADERITDFDWGQMRVRQTV